MIDIANNFGSSRTMFVLGLILSILEIQNLLPIICTDSIVVFNVDE